MYSLSMTCEALSSIVNSPATCCLTTVQRKSSLAVSLSSSGDLSLAHTVPTLAKMDHSVKNHGEAEHTPDGIGVNLEQTWIVFTCLERSGTGQECFELFKTVVVQL